MFKIFKWVKEVSENTKDSIRTKEYKSNNNIKYTNKTNKMKRSNNRNSNIKDEVEGFIYDHLED